MVISWLGILTNQGFFTAMPKRLFTKIRKIVQQRKGHNAHPHDAVAAYTVITPDRHNFHRSAISPAALQIVDTLTSKGYEAYIVGGCIRDSLLGKEPKDFDVSTNAHPEEIKALFRNCRLIGRRFRLAHVRIGREVIEVATFRANHQNAADNAGNNVPANKQQASQSNAGLLLRDNVFGTLDDDAERRDFTVNALYYRPSDQCLIDHVSGFDDVQSHTLRLIGEPTQRYKEDPVRILRALRFTAKLNFTMTPETQNAIAESSELLGHIPAARLFDEMLKLFLSGSAERVWTLLNEHDTARWLFPDSIEENNPNPAHQAMITQVMKNTDIRIAEGKRVTPAFLFAVMLWGPLMRKWDSIKAEGVPPTPAFQQAIQRVTFEQAQVTTIPKRFAIPLRDIWELQLKLPQRSGKRAQRTVEHKRFRAAYDLLLLREEAGDSPPGIGDWWTEYQEADEARREAMSASVKNPPGSGRKKRRRKPKSRHRQPQQPSSDS